MMVNDGCPLDGGQPSADCLCWDFSLAFVSLHLAPVTGDGAMCPPEASAVPPKEERLLVGTERSHFLSPRWLPGATGKESMKWIGLLSAEWLVRRVIGSKPWCVPT